MNISELNGKALKKCIDATRCCFRYHNKNGSGGNFGFEIRGFLHFDLELHGYYNNLGEITHLRLGVLYSPATQIVAKDFCELVVILQAFKQLNTPNN